MGRIFRFAIIGCGATVAYVGAAIVAVEFGGLSPELATTIGFTAAFGVSYTGHRAFTFAVQSCHEVYLPRFLVTAVTTYFMNIGIVVFAVDVLSLPYQVGLGVVAVVIPLVNYIMGRYWVFESGLRETAH